AQADIIDGGLRLDSRPSWIEGGDSGTPIVPGDPEASLLINAIRYENVELQMPPDGKLAQSQIDDLVKWVRSGAPDPRAERDSGQATASTLDTFDLTERVRSHWAWQPRRSVAPPDVQHTEWPRSDIDRFILARLEEAGLHPAPEADRRTWLRRVTFDLTGLPPTPVEIEQFLANSSPQACQQVVDRLLASVHFGEHWAQHWLDLVRFAETRGFEQDLAIPEAYRYRDYVIEALNADVPYNDWILEHIAGDLIDRPRLHPVNRTNQSIQGTGFWHLGVAKHGPIDIRGDEAERVHNQIDVFSRTFLGLSMGCARCHDHKFDAISTNDYYAFYGYLQSSSYHLADVSDPHTQQTIAEQLHQLRQTHESKWRRQLANIKRHQLQRLREGLMATCTMAFQGRRNGIPDGLGRPSYEKLRAHLKAAANDIDSPLHLVARVIGLEKQPSAGNVRHEQRSLLDKLRKRQQAAQSRERSLQVVRSTKVGERNYQPVTRAWTESDIVEIYDDQLHPDHWITAGHRFGKRPARIGEFWLETHKEGTPRLRVVASNCAASNRLSPKLTGMLR
ncbi:MAG: DUF1549 domain-containing protein, partial [Pirellulales bacterium]|nr:DUF1549 domain-containing protein [Pirellulales bacterium]